MHNPVTLLKTRFLGYLIAWLIVENPRSVFVFILNFSPLTDFGSLFVSSRNSLMRPAWLQIYWFSCDTPPIWSVRSDQNISVLNEISPCWKPSYVHWHFKLQKAWLCSSMRSLLALNGTASCWGKKTACNSWHSISRSRYTQEHIGRFKAHGGGHRVAITDN